ncbi:sigma-70 family RNA polymerase sigma factor [Pedobacter sp. Du54]|uniref:RNA polymerase sigma factor n=1 Tax=Pedobacter anseongensis TaxID=3133439 RepID=UPI0030ABE0ED
MPNVEKDLALIEKILGGDPRAFGLLLDQYQSFAFNLAMKFTTNNRQLAEEITQDVFLKVLKSLPTYKAEAKFSTWLYRIIFTTSISEVRKKKRLVLLDDLEQQYTDLLEIDNWNSYPADEKVLKNEIRTAISQLGEADAIVLELYYLNEQSIEEISSILNLEKNVIKARLFRARKRIKQLLEPKISTYRT